ncbi:MAG: HAMP domain-containing histidine kinase [Candidatus Hydrogenedentes bacterium]|nr:HAMP domain-containing histidine kinase [Candidatus Hydrogenedentota bacterium]
MHVKPDDLPSGAIAPAFGTPDFDARAAGLFRHAQVGRCVNGVAHDLNNYLGAVMAYAELVSLDKGVSAESHRMLGEILGAVHKASTLVSEIVRIARKDSARVGMVDPSLLVQHVLNLHMYEMKTLHIAVETKIQEDVPSLPGNAPKLELALAYLVRNAMETLEEQEKRHIFLRLHHTEGEVVIRVQDSGPPVPEALRERMFEPYVTTKAGVHFGLGLPLARAIIAQHAGALTYMPEEGFVITLPLENGLTPI